jgi:hypothetical protein
MIALPAFKIFIQLLVCSTPYGIKGTIAHSQGLARQTEEILEDGTIRLVLA